MQRCEHGPSRHVDYSARCPRRALTVQLQQAKTPESAFKPRAAGPPRAWSVNLHVKPASGPQFCRQDAAQPDTLLASVAPGSQDARRLVFDQVLFGPTLKISAGTQLCWLSGAERAVGAS